MKIFKLLFQAFTFTGVFMTISSASIPLSAHAEQTISENDALHFNFKKLDGQGPLALSDYRGKVILVVNTASQCGFTKQYEGLEKLYEAKKSAGLVIVGVPSNDFGEQEPGTSEEIAHFCKRNYGVSFPMTQKEKVSGKDAHPFYLELRKVLGEDAEPKWNFHKILIDKSGRFYKSLPSKVTPESETLNKEIDTLLGN